LTTADFVAHLRSLDIRLTIEDERLRCSAPKGTLTAPLRDELAARKSEVLAWIRANGDARETIVSAPTLHDGEIREPLSFAQLRLWFIAQFEPASYAYNITGGIRMRGQLAVDALERSIGEVVRRHESLRTVFGTIDGEPMQVIVPYRSVPLSILDLQVEPEAKRAREAERLLVEEGRRPFDLSRGPLFRARLIRLAPDDHLLQLTMHHIVADGWSLAVLYRELTALYKSQLEGGDGIDLPSLPPRYIDIARAQRERLQGDVLERHEMYWKSVLTRLPPTLEMPADFPRPALQTSAGSVESFLVPAALAGRLHRLSLDHGATLFMTVLSAFTVVLYRYTGATDIAVGVPIANRLDVKAESVIGLLINTLVLRTDLGGDPSFIDLLHRVRDVALGAYVHQDYPFERLVETLKPPRDLSHSVLFQVMFLFQNLPPQQVTLPGLTLTYPVIRTGTAKTDLTLEVVEQADGLGMFMEYNTDLFKADTIRRLCGHLERLLSAIVDDPARRISQLPLLGEDEYRRVTLEWNATDVPGLDSGTVPALFTAQAARTPDAPAARFDAQPISYRALNAQANRLAHHLRRHGVGPNALVGVFVERSLDMLVAVLAVMKSGGAYVPLDPAYPPERLAFMLQDAMIGVVVTQSTLLDRLALSHSVRVLCLDRDAPAIAAEPGGNPGDEPDAGDLAYVIYTSGSTGRPKGVQISHRALANAVNHFRSALNVGERDVLVALTTLSFDIAGLELFMPLVCGAQVVIGNREVVVDPPNLMKLFADAHATIVQATPPTWRMLLEAGWREAVGLRILCGGEAFPAELARPLAATGASIINVYGPTETTIWSTMHSIDGSEISVPIGRPIANTRTYVLDAGGEPTPIGVPGELYIGGAGVANGYLNQPALTADKFGPDRFSGAAGARLYRTGDIARFRADGVLEFLGRADHQIKLRGFRIELGEIESVLASHPSVAQAVVVPRADEPNATSLAAYLRLRGTMTSPAAELRAFLREQLPEYMVPSTFKVLDEFPLTPNGKVDRRRLPAPDADRSGSAVPFLAPNSALEVAIADVWRDLLRLETVGVDDNFFDLGGHSLLVVQVQARLRQKIGIEIAIVELFQYPTIRSIAAQLARKPATAEA
jgi:amino acid adenylation domain-containing protein